MNDKSLIYNNMRYAKDECYTTYAESIKLIDYLEENNKIFKEDIIWLPFDNELSNLYKVLNSRGYTLEISNLELGLDFYVYEPKKWDIIITNPPFSKRSEFMNRILSFDKRFVVLQQTQSFNNQTFTRYLCEYNFEFIMPQSRMNFLTYSEEIDRVVSGNKGIAFYCYWLTYKIGFNKTFNYMKNNGLEKTPEQYDVLGNIIKDNHYSLFSFLGELEDADKGTN